MTTITIGIATGDLTGTLHIQNGQTLNAETIDTTLVISLTKLLPSVLAVHFAGLPTLVPAYEASYLSTIREGSTLS